MVPIKLKAHEIKTLRLVLTGLPYPEIAPKLKISAHALTMRVYRVMFKTGARNRYELFSQLIEHPEWLGLDHCEHCGKIRDQLAAVVTLAR
jgi:DNA-binding CsgD family transcriptional regulator